MDGQIKYEIVFNYESPVDREALGVRVWLHISWISFGKGVPRCRIVFKVTQQTSLGIR